MNPTDVDGGIMLITAIFGLGCNILNIVILNCCCNDKGEKGEKVHLFESIASAYKPMHGNKIASEIKSIKSRSNKGSVISKSNESLLHNYDVDAIKEEDNEESPAVAVDTSQKTTPNKLNSTIKLDATASDGASLL